MHVILDVMSLFRAIGKLQGKANNQLSVLEHVVEANLLNDVSVTVDVWVGVVHGSFEDHGSWVSIASCRCVVGASITTGGIDSGD